MNTLPWPKSSGLYLLSPPELTDTFVSMVMYAQYVDMKTNKVHFSRGTVTRHNADVDNIKIGYCVDSG